MAGKLELKWSDAVRMESTAQKNLTDAVFMWARHLHDMDRTLSGSIPASRRAEMEYNRLASIIRDFDSGRSAMVDEFQKLANDAVNLRPPAPILLCAECPHREAAMRMCAGQGEKEQV